MTHGLSARDQDGFTLVEVLVVLAVVVPLVLGASIGMFTAIRVSDNNATDDAIGTALQNASELLGSGTDYQNCATPGDYVAAPALEGVRVTIDAIAYWDQSAAAYGAECGTDEGAQRITMSATRGGRTGRASFVKRDVERSVSTCAWTMLADGASRLFPLDETKREQTAIDVGSDQHGTYEGSHQIGPGSGVCAADSDIAVRLGGNRHVSTTGTVSAGRDRDRTEEVWFRTRKRQGVLLAIGDTQRGASASVGMLLSVSPSGKVVYNVSDGRTAYTVVSPASYADNRWHHAVAVYKGGGGGTELYVDGELVGTDPDAITETFEAAYLRIGYENTAGFPEGFGSDQRKAHFDGWLRFAAWYDRALTPTEIASHYAVGKPE